MNQPVSTLSGPADAPAAPRDLRGRFRGGVYLPSDTGYDERRRPLRQDIDPWPAMIVEAAGSDDVRAAVLTARELGLPFAVQSTGHGTHVAADGALLLRTSGMGAVLVDPARRTARVGAGARWEQVLAATSPFGLAPLSGSSASVGVAGYTLGGGVGWLSRKHGFAADSVLRAEVVLPDGRLVVAGPDQYPDLFWALRGGGGNFGVVTSLEFRVYEVPEVYAGAAYFPVEAAGPVLTRYREWAEGAPRETSTAVVLRRMPDSADVPEAVRGRRVLVVKVMHQGDAAEAGRVLRPLWTAAGPALAEELSPMPFARAAMGGTAARYFDLFPKLNDQVIAELVAAHESNDATVEIRHWGGAMGDPGPDAGPVGHRHVPFSVIVDAPGPDLAATLRPHAIGGAFLNFLGDPSRTEAAYTAANLRRLREVKRFYDPDNFFGGNHNIAPAAAPRPAVRRLAVAA